jgi:flagellar motor component MotA
MNHTEFLDQYAKIAEKALRMSKKARREGVLALENDLDYTKADKRDLFEYGLRFGVDGTASEWIEEILSNIIAQERDEQVKTLKTIQKEAVLMILERVNPRVLYAVLNSYTDIPLDEDPVKKILEE